MITAALVTGLAAAVDSGHFSALETKTLEVEKVS